jgi:hyperosmotically inducible protein
MVKSFGLAFVSLALSAGLAGAAPSQWNDRQVLDAVSTSVTTYSFFTIFDDVHAAVHDGIVTLSGKITMPYKSRDIDERVRKIDGVREVRNELEILPVSFLDDQLRYQIAHAIYDNPAFWYAGLMPNRPIHIVVDRGHVTITGVVPNDMDKTILRSLAGQSSAFSVTVDVKTPAEVSAELECA